MKELYELREQYRGKMNLYIGIETDCLGPVQKAEYTIGYHFAQAVKVARSCGFDRTLILKPGGGFREIYLP